MSDFERYLSEKLSGLDGWWAAVSIPPSKIPRCAKCVADTAMWKQCTEDEKRVLRSRVNTHRSEATDDYPTLWWNCCVHCIQWGYYHRLRVGVS